MTTNPSLLNPSYTDKSVLQKFLDLPQPNDRVLGKLISILIYKQKKYTIKAKNCFCMAFWMI